MSSLNMIQPLQRVQPESIFNLNGGATFNRDQNEKTSMKVSSLNVQKLIGIVLALIALVVLTGWAIGSITLVEFVTGSPAMAMNTAVLFFMCGVYLIFPPGKETLSLPHRAVALLILALSGAVLIEHIFNIDLGIDLANLQRSIPDTNPWPGRMAPNTCVAFLCTGLVLFFLNRPKHGQHTQKMISVLSVIVLVIGFAAVLGYILNLDVIYQIASFNGMAAPTAACFVVLGIGLWILDRQVVIRPANVLIGEDQRITRLSVGVLTVLAIAAGLTGFAVLRQKFEESNAANILNIAKSNATTISNEIEHALRSAKLVATRADLINALVNLNTHSADTSQLELLTQIGNSFLPFGYDRIRFFNARGELLVTSGRLNVDRASVEFRLANTANSKLLWKDGLLLETVSEIKHQGQLIGSIVIEQRLSNTTTLLAEMQKIGTSNDAVLCGLDVDAVVCFPSRFYPANFRTPLFNTDGQPKSASARALLGRTGSAQINDLRGILVLAGYAPLRPFGLGLVVKTDIEEVYTPLRERFNLLAVLLIIFVAIGTFVLRTRVQPLVRALFREKERLRVTLNSIGDAVITTDTIGNIVYLNPVAETMTGWRDEEASGLPLSAVFKIVKKNGELDDNSVHAVLSDKKLAPLPKSTVLIQRGGERFDIEESEAPMRDFNGRIIGVVLVFRDITARLQAQEALNLRDRAIQVSANPILIVDMEQANTPIIYVNDAFEKDTGYSREEVLGRNCNFLQREDVNQPELEKIRDAIREGRAGTALLRNYRKDGSLFLNELHIAPVRDPFTSKVTHFVGMQKDVTNFKRYQEELERQANYDSLTGLVNRNLLQELLQQTILQSKRTGRMFAVAFVDIDHFKRINDTFGHAAGDELIKAVGARLLSCIREGDTVARLGGDEFVLLMPELEFESSIFGMMQRVDEALAKPVAIHDIEIKVTFSIGLAMYPRDGDSSETLLDNADVAMYRAKTLGRNNFQFYTAELNAHSKNSLTFEADLWRSLERSELLLHYQPQIDLRTGRVIGMEALIRWMHPTKGLISPLEFIPIAEENGMIVAIGEWVLRTACEFNRQLQDDGLPPVRVAVNLSARQLRDKKLVDTIGEALKASRLDPQYLEIEITESMVMHDPEEAILLLHTIKNLGVQMSLDDFGTGYSSLAYLKKFPVDRLKIDRSFVMDMVSDPEDAAIVSAVIALSHSLGVEVIAEGIETLEVRDALVALKCDEAQGYFYSKPLASEDTRCFLTKNPTFEIDR
jgi:diguanylate cyclase (GGDEF)-like protein/PAS domain S-box-containing protein